MDDKELVAEARALAEEWFEMCGDIHEPLLRYADRIEALTAKAEALAEALREAIQWDSHDAEGVPAVWLDDAAAALKAWEK